MSLLNWIFDFYQQYRIEQLQKETVQAQTAIRAPGGAVDADRLERAIGELALAVKTMQRVLVEKGVCSQDEFRDKLQKIDAEDGRADGRAPV
jgi:hypothetical protein